MGEDAVVSEPELSVEKSQDITTELMQQQAVASTLQQHKRSQRVDPAALEDFMGEMKVILHLHKIAAGEVQAILEDKKFYDEADLARCNCVPSKACFRLPLGGRPICDQIANVL